MIRKDYYNEQTLGSNPIFVIDKILEDNKDYYLSKEEIYEFLPRLGDERVITIGQLNSTLREMCKFNKVDYRYIRGRAYYSYRKEN